MFIDAVPELRRAVPLAPPPPRSRTRRLLALFSVFSAVAIVLGVAFSPVVRGVAAHHTAPVEVAPPDALAPLTTPGADRAEPADGGAPVAWLARSCA